MSVKISMRNKKRQILILSLAFLVLAGWKGNPLRSVGSAPEFLSIFPTTFASIDVTVRENIAYMTEYEKGLHIIDCSDPLNLIEISQLDLLPNPGGVALQGELLYVASSETAFSDGLLKAINIEDPSKPYEVGFLEIPGGVLRLTLNGEVAYVSGFTQTSAVLYVVNIDEASNMRILETIEAPHGTFFRLVVEGNLAYAAVGGDGLWILDITDPTSPEIISKFYPQQGAIFDIAKRGNYVYAANHAGLFFWRIAFDRFLVIDVSDVTNPTPVSSFITYRRVPVGLAVMGDSVYVALESGKEQSVLAQIFVKDPQHPRRIGGVQTSEPGHNLIIQDDLIFLPTLHGLEIYRVPF